MLRRPLIFMKEIFLFATFSSLIGLWGCSGPLLQRTSESGFRNYNESNSSLESSPEGLYPDTFQKVAPSRPEAIMTSEDRLLIAQRQRLRILERALATTKEKEQYAKVISFLKSDSEKIAFLQIPSIEERQIWIQKQGLWTRFQGNIRAMKPLVDNQDIAIGMPQEMVRKSWGEPIGVEVSGNPLYKNERWKYVRSVTVSDGFKQERRFVYFEGGRVVGWETE